MLSKISILLMSHKMNLGGTEKALLSFLNGLDNKKHHVTLLLLESGGDLFDAIPEWVQVEILPNFEEIKPIIFSPPHHLAKSKFLSGKFFEAFRTIKRYFTIKLTDRWYVNYIYALKNTPIIYHADVAIAFAGPSDFITYYVSEKVQAKTKYQWIHFDVGEVIQNKKFGNTYYPLFDKIFCVSENAKRSFEKMFPLLLSKTSVFKNIVSHALVREQSTKGDTFSDSYNGLRIITLGRLSQEKGQDMIPEVVYKLKKEGFNFRWYLIGDGKLYPEMQKKIISYNLEEDLILLGSKKNPYGYLRDCDVYVQTSRHEGYCLTLHEAKVFNKPVVTTNFLSASNLVKNKEDGLIVETSVEGLFEGVKSLLAEEQLRNRLSHSVLVKDTSSEIEKLFR